MCNQNRYDRYEIFTVSFCKPFEKKCFIVFLGKVDFSLEMQLRLLLANAKMSQPTSYYQRSYINFCMFNFCL